MGQQGLITSGSRTCKGGKSGDKICVVKAQM